VLQVSRHAADLRKRAAPPTGFEPVTRGLEERQNCRLGRPALVVSRLGEGVSVDVACAGLTGLCAPIAPLPAVRVALLRPGGGAIMERGGRVAEESEPYRVSPAPQGDAGSRERLDPLAATKTVAPGLITTTHGRAGGQGSATGPIPSQVARRWPVSGVAVGHRVATRIALDGGCRRANDQGSGRRRGGEWGSGP